MGCAFECYDLRVGSRKLQLSLPYDPTVCVQCLHQNALAFLASKRRTDKEARLRCRPSWQSRQSIRVALIDLVEPSIEMLNVELSIELKDSRWMDRYLRLSLLIVH